MQSLEFSLGEFTQGTPSRSRSMPIDTEPSVEDVVLGVCYSAIAAARRQSDFVGWERPLLKIPRDAYDTWTKPLAR